MDEALADRVLRFVRERGPATVCAVAAELGLSTNRASQILRRLHARGRLKRFTRVGRYHAAETTAAAPRP